MTTDPIVDYFLAGADGRILATGKCRLSRVSLQSRESVTAHMGVATEYQWFDAAADELRQRGTFACSLTHAEIRADGVETTRILGVPAGAEIRVMGPTAVMVGVHAGGDVEFRTSLAGRYSVHLDHPRYLPVVVDIVAVAP